MRQRLNLPAVAAYLRGTAPTAIAADHTSPRQPGAPQTLDAARWLELLAAVLGCSPEWLTGTGRITADDLAERGSIAAAARLIRSYSWESPPPPARSPPPDPPANTSAATRPAAWLAARDAYHGHIMGCSHCRAFLPRDAYHCPTGASLRRAYDAA
ncbi:hypothetical protein [Azotobacter beijerinckii]|uniref:hypothetical protein n=1 Tax=Azotobacter beijerinckii TaxID=170623 RepID=UPI0029538059|nr:hypothetical protein [Azotobacter beijerinckii]MDV7211076.1 hypothetical protein [Azotobacter beijerinckii]